MRRSLAFVALLVCGLAGPAFGQECAFTIEGNDQIQYNLKEMRVSSSCSEVTVTLRHVGQLAENIMGHNWVLTTTADFQAVATAGQSAGPPEYLPADDQRIIAHTEMIGGGQETSVSFSLSELEAGGDYTFFCSFPGHYVLMNGKFIIE